MPVTPEAFIATDLSTITAAQADAVKSSVITASYAGLGPNFESCSNAVMAILYGPPISPKAIVSEFVSVSDWKPPIIQSVRSKQMFTSEAWCSCDFNEKF